MSKNNACCNCKYSYNRSFQCDYVKCKNPNVIEVSYCDITGSLQIKNGGFCSYVRKPKCGGIFFEERFSLFTYIKRLFK